MGFELIFRGFLLQGKEATTTLAFGKLGGADAVLRQKRPKSQFNISPDAALRLPSLRPRIRSGVTPAIAHTCQKPEAR